MRITREMIQNQIKKDRLAHDALPLWQKRILAQQMNEARQSTYTNFSDPEAL